MRSRKRFGLAITAATLLSLAVAAPSAAHELVVGPSAKTHWVGGDTVPEAARSAPPMFGPFSLPPSHMMGLPHACMATNANPSAVTFVAPPFGSCHHGVMP